jgi:hypothetical protein
MVVFSLLATVFSAAVLAAPGAAGAGQPLTIAPVKTINKSQRTRRNRCFMTFGSPLYYLYCLYCLFD